MKRSILGAVSALVLSLCALGVMAQPGGGMNMNPEAQIKELIAQLDVTAEQEPAFREAMAQINAQRMSAMQEMRGGQGAMRQNAQGGDHAGHGAGGDQQDTARGGNNAAGGMRQGGGMERMMARRQEMQKQAEEVLAKVLNADQLNRYREIENERMARMMERRPGQQ